MQSCAPPPPKKKSYIAHSADIGLDINVCDSSIIKTLIKYGLFESTSYQTFKHDGEMDELGCFCSHRLRRLSII